MRIRFDRGTLVIDRCEAGLDRTQLLDATWDHTLSAWRLPAERLSELRGRLADKPVRLSDEIGQTGWVELSPGWSLPPLREYQRDAVEAWRDSGDRGVIVLPTGSGKTLVAIAAIAELGIATLVLVPTRVLLDQWVRALSACWRDETGAPMPIGRLGDGDHQVLPITVATYASAVVWAPRVGDRFGLVVVDEAHHVGGWCPREVLEMLVAPSRLGLTATPPDGIAAGALGAHIGPTVFERDIEDLRGTALADYTHEMVPIELSAEERAAYRATRGVFARFYTRQQRMNGGQMSWSAFVQEAQRSDEGREALANWRASRALIAFCDGKRAVLRRLITQHAEDRILVFTGDNTTAYEIARQLLVNPITCDIGRRERAEMVRKFVTGESSVLVSAQVLDEGFDVPDADVAIVVGGTSSQRRQVQRVGRVLRPRPGKHALVYELVVQSTAEVRQAANRQRSSSAIPAESWIY